jgi:hypothetical protein
MGGAGRGDEPSRGRRVARPHAARCGVWGQQNICCQGIDLFHQLEMTALANPIASCMRPRDPCWHTGHCLS